MRNMLDYLACDSEPMTHVAVPPKRGHNDAGILETESLFD